MSDSICSSVAVGIIKTVVCVYDVLTLPIYFIFQRPWEARRLNADQRAKPLRPDDPYSPWIRLDQPPKHYLHDCKTLDQLLRKSIATYKDKKCFGYREVLGEENEPQPDGKTFKKIILGDYQWLSYDDANERIDNIAKGLMATGVKPRDLVLILAETRLEWMLTGTSFFSSKRYQETNDAF